MVIGSPRIALTGSRVVHTVLAVDLAPVGRTTRVAHLIPEEDMARGDRMGPAQPRRQAGGALGPGPQTAGAFGLLSGGGGGKGLPAPPAPRGGGGGGAG